MRIKAKPLDISEDTGFDPSIDIFKRALLGERISTLLETTEEGLIIGIDGAWGEGKSTFSKMLRGHLKKEKNITTIYFDAFENDYQKDPFLAIASQIIQQTTTSNTQSENFKKTAVKATKTLLRGALRVGIKAATAGILDETILDNLDVSDDAGSEISTGLDKFLAEKLENSQEDKDSLNNFRKELEKIATELGNGKPLTFIIDELDRCRPDYCVELLEQIKHLFIVKNLNFIIVTNKSQILASIQKKYGQDINAHLYLQKFIDLWISLPRVDSEYESHPQIYMDFLLPRLFNEGENIKNELMFRILAELFKSNKTSLRGIEKTLSYAAILYNSTNNGYLDHYQAAIAVVCYCKAEQPEALYLITEKQDHLLATSQIFPRIDEQNSSLIGYVKAMIKFCLSTDEEKKALRENSQFFTHSREIPRGNTFSSAAKALDNLKL